MKLSCKKRVEILKFQLGQNLGVTLDSKTLIFEWKLYTINKWIRASIMKKTRPCIWIAVLIEGGG